MNWTIWLSWGGNSSASPTHNQSGCGPSGLRPLLFGAQPMSTAKRSPLGAIRVFCLECQGQSSPAVTACMDTSCPAYNYRLGEKLPVGVHRPLPAIRTYCLTYCQSGNSSEEVKSCCGNKPTDHKVQGPCQLFPFRLGKNPNISAATRAQRHLSASKRVAKGASGFVSNS